MFTATLCVIASTLETAWLPPTIKWINKLSCVHAMEYYTEMKRTNSVTCNNMDECQEHSVAEKRPDYKRVHTKDSAYIQLKSIIFKQKRYKPSTYQCLMNFLSREEHSRILQLDQEAEHDRDPRSLLLPPFRHAHQGKPPCRLPAPSELYRNERLWDGFFHFIHFVRSPIFCAVVVHVIYSFYHCWPFGLFPSWDYRK